MKILILLTLVGAIAAQQRNLSDEKSNIQNAVRFCRTNGPPLNTMRFIKMRSRMFKELDGNENARCFADCVMRNLKMITGTSVLDTNVVKEKMLTFGASNSEAQQCFGITPYGSYKCIQGWDLLKCICTRTREFCTALS